MNKYITEKTEAVRVKRWTGLKLVERLKNIVN